jgi:integrase/recombinase XerC
MDLIAEYREHLTDLARSPRTIHDYEDILRRADRQLPHGLCGATADELRGWIFTDRRGAASRLLYRTIVCGFFAWATCPPDDPDAPWLDYDPSRHLPHVRRPRRKPKPVSTEQLTDMLTRATAPYRTWFLLAAYAGLRCVEISRCDRQHVTETHVWVPSGKGDRERYVPTHPALWRAVAELPPGPIALDHDGVTRLTPQKVAHRGNHQLRKMQAGASMHRLRHWFGTQTYARTKDLRTVQDLLGHADVSTTQGYVEVVDAQRTAAVAALPDLT